jgi:drug/metabolite transporter (DMT)-like permease
MASRGQAPELTRAISHAPCRKSCPLLPPTRHRQAGDLPPPATVMTVSTPSPGTLTLTALALSAFAANSLLCRLALGTASIDAASFTSVRLVSGTLMLWLLVALIGGERAPIRPGRQWLPAAMLFLYAIAFSFAYVSLGAGTGALILFGCVQLTMLLAGLYAGERPRPRQWAGIALAFAGLAWLVAPGLTAPAPAGAALMAAAGIAWGAYSLLGRGASNPSLTTARNFARAVPFTVVLSLLALPQLSISPEGLLLATLSGALASGLGYIAWYAALPALTATSAASVQLAVPVLTAAAGVVLLDEPLTLRLIVSAAAILGGIALALLAGQRRG